MILKIVDTLQTKLRRLWGEDAGIPQEALFERYLEPSRTVVATVPDEAQTKLRVVANAFYYPMICPYGPEDGSTTK